MKRKITFYLLCCSFFLGSTQSFSQAVSYHHPQEEEILHAKRIIELSEMGEVTLTISQIKLFFKNYPASVFKESMLAILGNSYWMTKKFSEALKAYEGIISLEFQQRIFDHQVDALMQLGKYRSIIEILRPKVSCTNGNFKVEQQQNYTLYLCRALFFAAQESANLSQKEEYLNESEILLLSLTESPLEKQAWEELALVASQKMDFTKAADTYFLLAQKYPSQKEVFLYKGAKSLSQIDPEKALLVLSEAQKKRDPHQSELILFKTDLMFQLNYDQHIINEFSDQKNHVSEKHYPFLVLYVAKSYYRQKEYQSAITLLEPLVEENRADGLPLKAKQELLSCLLSSLYAVGDLTKAESILQMYCDCFQDNEMRAHALFYKALATEKQSVDKALAVLESLISHYPNFSDLSKVKYHRNRLLFHLKNFELARETGIAFLKAYPEYENNADVAKRLFLCTKEIIKCKRDEGSVPEEWYALLVEDMVSACHYGKIPQNEADAQIMLTQADCYYQMQQYDLAAQELGVLIDRYPNYDQLHKAYLLLADCTFSNENYEQGIKAVEKALALNPGLAKDVDVQLKLFNMNIKLYKKAFAEHDTKQELFLDAASHALKSAFFIKQNAIPLDKRLWLVNYLVNKIESNALSYEFIPLAQKEKELAKEALQIYESIYEWADFLQVREEYKEIYTSSDEDVLHIAKLYGWLNETSHALQICNILIENHFQATVEQQTIYGQALFIMAQIYEQQNKISLARDAYAKLSLIEKLPKQLEYASQLRHAALELTNEKPVDLENSLKKLKNLQIHKQLATEPIHLEAALEYAKSQAKHLSKGNQNPILLSLLKEMKRDFIIMDDVLSKDYHSLRQQNASKEKIYQAYMMLIDGFISYLEADLAVSKKEIKWKKEIARNIFENLLKNQQNHTSYLTKHIQEALQVGD